eukprot:TRINITY_DN49001_c0_g1_i1.p1 TRINITY_DN49001_c0_g1~~TRINITY_DN49001_c0_g1_i1.p1  ORF type:complete len:509 (+),score=69.70 TRINITY_DN49001_c0_g1_i1:74-1600(+)
MAVRVGTLSKDNGNFGFIKLDDEEGPDMFVIPPSCEAFGRIIPPIGTQVKFIVTTDAKTGRPRADHVQPIDDGPGVTIPIGAGCVDSSSLSGGRGIGSAGGGACGITTHDQAKSLAAKLLEGMPTNEAAALVASLTASRGGGRGGIGCGGGGDIISDGGERGNANHSDTFFSGTMSTVNGSYGFIKQDNGEPDMFALPPLPSLGSRVYYDVIVDSKTGRPRAENVVLANDTPLTDGYRGTSAPAPIRPHNFLDHAVAGMSEHGAEHESGYHPEETGHQESRGIIGMAPAPDRKTGTMVKDNGRFGFIKQDDGEADMFTLPPLFPLHTRVSYDVIVDAKTTRPRAENVQQLDEVEPSEIPCYGAAKAHTSPIRAQPYGPGSHRGGDIGIIGKGWGGKNAYKQWHHPSHHGYEDPQASWEEEQSVDAAEGLEQENEGAPVDGSFVTGTISKITEKFGFIQQDHGDADMFVIPPSCEAFGRQIPPIGTRVQYQVVIDGKTGRPRADSVSPL